MTKLHLWLDGFPALQISNLIVSTDQINTETWSASIYVAEHYVGDVEVTDIPIEVVRHAFFADVLESCLTYLRWVELCDETRLASFEIDYWRYLVGELPSP